MTPGREMRALDEMSNSLLWLKGTTPYRELRALDAMNSYG